MYLGIQVSQKQKVLLDNGVQCNIAHLPALRLLPTDSVNLGNTHGQDNASEDKECDAADEPFEDLDFEDADYNPSIESEEDDDDKQLAKSER